MKVVVGGGGGGGRRWPEVVAGGGRRWPEAVAGGGGRRWRAGDRRWPEVMAGGGGQSQSPQLQKLSHNEPANPAIQPITCVEIILLRRQLGDRPHRRRIHRSDHLFHDNHHQRVLQPVQWQIVHRPPTPSSPANFSLSGTISILFLLKGNKRVSVNLPLLATSSDFLASFASRASSRHGILKEDFNLFD
ncbi:hypothetical protein M5K25_026979 [Dendrobium thyrsiflorum]|uniref:Uncharacterized protein n=1 Tax=Dendrobium thyrsiflorum TaxID=117978 RepID=A0ABD0TYV6_DENTH